MKVYFFRHGVAKMREKWMEDDASRPLTKQGKIQVEAVARALKDMNLRVDIILTSPLKRALETAELINARLGLKENLIIESRITSGFSLENLMEVIKEYADKDSLMLVGHEPDFSEHIAALTGGRVLLKKAGIALVDIPDPSEPTGTLLWLCPPKVWEV